MAYPVDSSSTSMSGVYIPEIWSGKTLVKFYKVTVFGDIANTDYEGEISAKGDKVKIRTIPDITIRDYEIDQDLIYTKQPGSVIDLLIDKGKYYAIPYNIVEKKQADFDYIEKWTDDASQQMSQSIDRDILANVYADAGATNKGATAGKISQSFDMGATGTPREVTKLNILDVIVDMGTILDEQDRPQTDRFSVLPAALCGLIKKSELKDASLAGDGTSILRNGLIGGIDRFKIYSSNNLATTVDGDDNVFNTITGHKSAITFASQLTENEVVDNPKDFGKLMRGLQVYGYKVIQTDSLIHGYFKKG